jgi:hypothetical protein
MCFLLYSIMKYIFVFCFITFISCQSNSESDAGKADTISVHHLSEIPEARSVVKTTPAAEYSEPVKDELNDWKFAVALYETKRTFHYTMRIQCKEMRVNDTINIPNFGIEPKVEVHKGNEPLTAIIGFLDKKNVFQEYREVSFKNDKLRVRTLRTYSVGSYRK